MPVEASAKTHGEDNLFLLKCIDAFAISGGFRTGNFGQKKTDLRRLLD
jgi:hypothetical protein